MIFTHRLDDEITALRKTVTRRPCVSKAGRKFNPPAVGDLLPIQRGYAKAHAHARVLDVRRELFAGQVTDREAHREGVPGGAADFRRLWVGLYGSDPVPVYRIEFELLPREDGGR